MRSRIVGGVALFLGLLYMILVFTSHKPVDATSFLGGLLFIGLGGYYLFTGKRAATMNEFIADGRLGYEPSEDARLPQSREALVEKVTSAPDHQERMEALSILGQSSGIGSEQMDAIFQHAHAQADHTLEEIFDRVAKEQGLSEAERREIEAPLRQKLAEMQPGKKRPG